MITFFELSLFLDCDIKTVFTLNFVFVLDES